MRTTILFILLILNSLLVFSQKEYFLNTSKYTKDGGKTYIQQQTRFTIDVDKRELKKIIGNSIEAYFIFDITEEPDKNKSDRVTSTTVFQCKSSTQVDHLFVIIMDIYNDGTNRTTMSHVNQSTKKITIYLK